MLKYINPFNTITKQCTGTFFHLPIEELWLNKNEQLVSVDRGAFWDMPYLTRLHLQSCPMLMSINSQAFVGIQNLNFINVDGCQSLEQESRQLLENITVASTYRQLRLEQKQQKKESSNNSSTLDIGIQIDSTVNGTHLSQFVPQIIPKPPIPSTNNNNFGSGSSTAAAAQPDDISHIIEIANHRLKYAYYTTSLVFLIVSLKLVLKYTQVGNGGTSTLRSRRRVYGTSSSSPENDNPDHGVNGRDDEDMSTDDGAGYEMQERPDGSLQYNPKVQKKRYSCSSVSTQSEPSCLSIASVDRDQTQCDNEDEELEEPMNEIGHHTLVNDNKQEPSTDCEPIKVINEDICEAGRILSDNNLVEISLDDEQNNQQIAIEAVVTDQHFEPSDLGPTVVINQSFSNATLTMGQCSCSECPSYQPMEQLRTITINSSDNINCDHEMNGGPNQTSTVRLGLEINQISSEQDPLDLDMINCDLCNISRVDCSHGDAGLMSNQEPITSIYMDTTCRDDGINQLLQSQLLGSRYEFDHANCNHFYQSISSAIQFADLVNDRLRDDFY